MRKYFFRARNLETAPRSEFRVPRFVNKTAKCQQVQAFRRRHLFDLPAERMRESAEWRIKANNTVDLITGGLSTNPEADWAKLEHELVECYRSVQRELERAA